MVHTVALHPRIAENIGWNQEPLYTIVSYGLVNCIKNLSLGAAANSIISPISFSACHLAEKVGLMKARTTQTILDGYLNAPCKIQEAVNLVNSYLPRHLHTTVFAEKSKLIIGHAIIPSIYEEMICRGLIQDLLLTRTPKYLTKKIAPGKEVVFDSTMAKIVRIAFTAAIFSVCHLPNYYDPSDQMKVQLISSFVGGIGLGILKESEVGLIGAIGCHIAHNTMVLNILRC